MDIYVGVLVGSIYGHESDSQCKLTQTATALRGFNAEYIQDYWTQSVSHAVI